ncbi:DUF6600 domain-containing protein [Pedobacter nototheniae]|uniref:DUF6600 domain-containing protein n=1 Tax=Pedobacter nototheniae TaxID=2488994 RepID=UPI00292D7CA4|nr:DUF6600 domain-containing protein [Pedobacter nototheniae]
MKTLKSTALVLGLFGLLAGTTTLVRAQDYQNNYQDDGYNTGNVSLQTFYDELSPYGTWIQDPQYGYVWRPDVEQSDFRPYYTNGRWAMTEYGNTWVSNYDWGWAPFHYGRWVINSYRQWIWLPDTNWGPAWVDWRSGDGYYGWAPMAPSININLSFGRRYSVPEFCWNFIPQGNIYINSFPRYDYGRNNVYIRNTTIINNTYVYNRRNYYGGPRIEDIRRATNRDVRVYRFDQSSRPGASRVSGRDVSIYRPRPERNADNRNAAPRKFEQGNAGFNRNGRNAGTDNNRESRGGDNSRLGQRNDGRTPQTGSRTDVNGNRGDNNNTGGGVFNRGTNGRTDRIGQNGGDANQRSRQALERGNDQRTQTDQNGQRNQTDRSAQMEQQRQQRSQQQGQQQQQERNAQMEQQRAQRSQQIQEAQQQQRTQRDAQAQQQRSQAEQQQRAQRDAQAQQQRSQAEQQQRAQRDAQAQQQRSQAEQQQRTQRDAQAQQQRQQQQQQQQRMERTRTESAPPQQQNRGGGERSSSEGGRPSRSERG